jgi:membrane protease YdiL (CAAX protease family)
MTEPEDRYRLEPDGPLPAPEPHKYPFWTWLDVALLAGLVLPLLILATLLATGVFSLMGGMPRAKALGPLAVTFVFEALWFLALYQVIRLRYGRPFWPSIAWRRPPRGYLNSASWGIILAFASILVGALLRPPETKTPLEQLLADPLSIVLTGLFAVTLGPLFEEVAFRGFLMPLVVRSLGTVAGIVLTAAPFALLHGFEYAWTWQQLVIVFLAGSAFGWMRLRSGSTAAATIMHGTYNLTFFLALVAQKINEN